MGAPMSARSKAQSHRKVLQLTMKNLRLLNEGQVVPESRTYPDLSIADAVFDSTQNSILFALTLPESGILEVQQFMKTGACEVLASFPVSEAPLLSFVHFGDQAMLVFAFGNGDIVTATYDLAEPDPETTVVEIVGSIDVGILAAVWSYDEETFAILTAENKLVLLLRLLEPIGERMLDQNDIKITDSKHVSVGWGKKETQFKGRGAKAAEREREALKHAGLDENAELLKDPTVGEIERGVLSSADAGVTTISWRGDSEYLAISTVEQVVVEDTGELYDRRVIRVFNREGELNSVNEAVDGLEHNLAWRPQGHIASTQRHTDEEAGIDVVFYERNGLRHGEFNSRLNPDTHHIIDLQWSSDSSVLAVHARNHISNTDKLQLWTTKNYHWYLKQEISMPPILFLKFHPEKPLHLMVGAQDKIRIIDLVLTLATGPCIKGIDNGAVMVIDGSELKFTPMAVANVPPPMAYREVELGESIVDVACDITNELVVALTNDQHIILVSVPPKGPAKVLSREPLTNYVSSEEFVKQVAANDKSVAVLVDGDIQRVLIFDLGSKGQLTFTDSIDTTAKIVLIKATAEFNGWALEAANGVVYQIVDGELQTVNKFPQLCRDFELITHNDVTSAFGISANGKLFANDIQICTGVTSLKLTESHLLFTTVRNHLCFVHLDSEYNEFDEVAKTGSDERIRQIEQGSVLVTAIPSKYSVVLQAPRGNLETICPRIMVLTAVRDFIRNKQYGDAFTACRVHRIDLDILFDYDPQLFLSNVELFVKQIKKVGHLDLFVSCLHEEDVTKTKYRDTLGEVSEEIVSVPIEDNQQVNTTKKIIHNNDTIKVVENSKVNKICDAILKVLLKPNYFNTYLQTIVTAYACKNPPNLTETLQLINNLEDSEQAEQALEHLCFLQDVQKLYNTALGIYNVKMTLAIAQKSQMDPKEYLPFLQNLHEQTELRRRFLIDDHLKNHVKALGWLHEIGEDAENEFDDYTVQHSLYQTALQTHHDNAKRVQELTRLFADHLHEQQNYLDAATSYEFLGDLKSACENYVLAKRWREALAIAVTTEKSMSVAEKLVSSLTDDHRYSEAAVILKDYLNKVDEAVLMYCKSYHYDEAILLAVKEKKEGLLETTIDSQLGDGFGTIAELLADCKGQMTSQLRRLRELREKKREDPYSFYDNPQAVETADNVSVAASETSTAPSFFTRYTGKTSGTAKTGASRRTAKNKKREERKRAKGRKGTIYEEEYLIRSIDRLIERLEQTQGDAVRLIEGLLRRKKREQAYQIQKNWIELIEFIKENLNEVHSMDIKDRERVDDNGEVYLIDEIPPPKVPEFPRKPVLDY